MCNVPAMARKDDYWRDWPSTKGSYPTGSGPTVRVNVTIPRELLKRFKAAIDGQALSTMLAELMRERLGE